MKAGTLHSCSAHWSRSGKRYADEGREAQATGPIKSVEGANSSRSQQNQDKSQAKAATIVGSQFEVNSERKLMNLEDKRS